MVIDDSEYVTEHPLVPLGLTWAGVGVAFTAKHSGNWHPLTTISHMADCQVFGVNPAGHHFVNILLHALNAVLVFWLFRSTTGSLWRSFFVAALFALHPLRVESVAWISERKDVLCAFFFLLTIWAYARYAQVQSLKSKVQSREAEGGIKNAASSIQHPASPSPSSFILHPSSFYSLALLFCALALLSKPMAVTLPCVLLLLDFWPLQRLQLTKDLKLKTLLPLLREKIPFFALSLVDCYITSQMQRHAMTALQVLPVSTRLCNMFLSYTQYLAKTFWPANLAGRLSL